MGTWDPISRESRHGCRRGRFGSGLSTSHGSVPTTIMPAYYRVDGFTRVMPAYRGRPVLTAEQVEDAVAFLLTLR